MNMADKLNLQDLNKVSGGAGKYRDYYNAVYLIHNTFAMCCANVEQSMLSPTINYFVDGMNSISAGNLKTAIEKLKNASKKMSSIKSSYRELSETLSKCISDLDAIIKELENL